MDCDGFPKLTIVLRLCTFSDPNFSWVVSFKEFAHPAFEVFSALGTVGPTFFLAVAMFGFVFQINVLIIEKELKLRQVSPLLHFCKR